MVITVWKAADLALNEVKDDEDRACEILKAMLRRSNKLDEPPMWCDGRSVAGNEPSSP